MSSNDLIFWRRTILRTFLGLAMVFTLGFASANSAVAQEVVAIAAGGPAQSNSSGGDYSFLADEDFSGGGDNQVSSAIINLAQPGVNAAPMGVYQHARAGVFTYTIPGLTSGNQYSVLLHFAETYFTAAGDREFNVAINGTTVLTNLDIYATVGANAALLETFTATANSSGQIVIAFTDGAANQPVVSGIEIRSSSSSSCSAVPSAPTGLTATASSSSAIGLSWTAATPPANCTINSYSVYGSTTSGFTPSVNNEIAVGLTGTEFFNTGLVPSSTYYYIVQAADEDGVSAQYSAQQSSATLALPTVLTAAASSANEIDLSWPESTAAAPVQYLIFRSSTPTFTPSSANQVGATKSNAYNDVVLTASTTYYYQVEASNTAGVSAPSGPVSATTLALGNNEPFWGTGNIPAAPSGDVMTFAFVNRTNGQYPDDQVWWSTTINGVTTTNTIAAQPYFEMPSNSSGRMEFYLGPQSILGLH
jgi:hypothetical protein